MRLWLLPITGLSGTYTVFLHRARFRSNLALRWAKWDGRQTSRSGLERSVHSEYAGKLAEAFSHFPREARGAC